jgi:hypothetical protein
MCSELRLGCAREYGSVPDDQKIVGDHEKCANFVIAIEMVVIIILIIIGLRFWVWVSATSFSTNTVGMKHSSLWCQPEC